MRLGSWQRADVDVSVALEHAFRGRGIEVITSAAVHQLEALEPGVRVQYRVGDESRTVDVDAAFFAVGWPGNADLVDAAAAGVATERGYVIGRRVHGHERPPHLRRG